MAMNYIWDTNIVIYFLEGSFADKAMAFIGSTISKKPPMISAITEMELLCWKTDNEKDMYYVEEFVHQSDIAEIDLAVKQKTIELKRICKIKLPDAIIAATAITTNSTLLTRNLSDFKNIQGLKVVNPFEFDK